MKVVSGFAVAVAFATVACSRQDDSSSAPASSASAVSGSAVSGSAVSAPVVFVPASPVSSQSEASQPSASPRSEASASLVVYKTPTCGCCKAWVEHLEQNGFKPKVMDMPDLSAVKAMYGIAPQLQSCHTAVVGDYTIEGHVPADLIIKMINEKPAIAGLAVPGMPAGSPGMEGATKERYDVLTFDRAGRTTVYAQR